MGKMTFLVVFLSIGSKPYKSGTMPSIDWQHVMTNSEKDACAVADSMKGKVFKATLDFRESFGIGVPRIIGPLRCKSVMQVIEPAP